MAYGTKYIIQYYDQLGKQTVINIKKNNYSGATSYLNGTDTPLVINYPDPGERFTPIRGSEARIQFYSDSPYTYLPLFTAGNREYYIDITKDGSAYWHGYLYPSVYQQQLTGAPYIIEVTAWDGLGRLNNYTFENYLGWPVFTDNSLLTIIRTCLEFTGLDKSIKVSTGITSNLSAAEFIVNHYIDTLTFIDDNEWMDAKTVLTEVLTALNARIYQVDKVWHIIGHTQYGSTITTNNYNDSGVFTGTSTITTKTITDADNSLGAAILCYLDGLQLGVELPVKDIKIVNSFAEKESILYGDFSAAYWSSATALQYWTNAGSLPLSLADDNESVIITGTINRNTTTPSYITQTLVFESTNTPSAFKFSLEAYADTVISNGANIEIIIKHRSSTFASYNYLQDDGSWSSTVNAVNFVVPVNKWKQFEIETDVFNMLSIAGNQFVVSISQLFGYGNTASATDKVYIKNITCENISQTEKVITTVERNVNDYAEESKDLTIIVGLSQLNRPDVKTVAPGVLKNSSGALVTSIINKLGTYADTSNMLSIIYDLYYSQPREVLSGAVYGYINASRAVYDSDHDMYYEIVSQSIDDKKCVNELQMYEIPDTSIIDGGVIPSGSFTYTLPIYLN